MNISVWGREHRFSFSTAEDRSELFSVVVHLFRQLRINRHHLNLSYRCWLLGCKVAARDESAEALLESLSFAG